MFFQENTKKYRALTVSFTEAPIHHEKCSQTVSSMNSLHLTWLITVPEKFKEAVRKLAVEYYWKLWKSVKYLLCSQK